MGVTDWHWYNYLRARSPEDINFWQPSGQGTFRALNPGGVFLFKLKSPYNAIGGLGYFWAHSQLPLNLAWDTFGPRNGFDTIEQFRAAIQRYRNTTERNPTIGCIALTNPIFFRQEDWIAIPANWSNSIVQGKKYNTGDAVGMALWQQVQSTISSYVLPTSAERASVVEEVAAQYGNSVLTKVRIGQGAFRLSVIDAYNKRCAITGEKTLPVLEAAHIQPFSEAGSNTVSNGLLLRSDMHKLFDDGYITITPELRIEVSQRIKEEFNNGKEYYQYHGKQLAVLPVLDVNKPSRIYLDYHNNTIFR